MRIYPKTWSEVTCNDWYEDENQIFLCHANKNAICEINKKSGQVKILGHYDSNNLAEESLSLAVNRVGNYVIFSPCNADKIAIIRLPEKEIIFKSFELTQRCKQYLREGKSKFYRMLAFDNKAIFFGLTIPTIMIFDLITFNISFFDDWVDEVLSNVVVIDGMSVFFSDGIIRDGLDIYASIGYARGILKFNIERWDWEYISIPTIEKGILGMCTYRGKFIITEMFDEKGRFIVWSRNSNTFEYIDSPQKGDYYRPIIVDNKMFLFSNPAEDARIYEYEYPTKKWNIISHKIFKDGERISAYGYREGVISFFTNGKPSFWRYDLKKNKYSKAIYSISSEENGDFLKESWMEWCNRHINERAEKLLGEGDYGINLNDYLAVITNKE